MEYMSLRLKTIFKNLNPVLVLSILSFLVHLVLFNINYCEWGDSYRILRGAQGIKQGFYPADEKRPPLFSALVALVPSLIPIELAAKLLLLVISVATVSLFVLYIKNSLKQLWAVYLAGLLFIFNPVYLYWSIRIMGDNLFLLLVLSLFYVFQSKTFEKSYVVKLSRWNISFNIKTLFIGALIGLALLTRFEGVLVLMAVTVYLFANSRYKDILYILVMAVLISFPYYFWKNPLFSTYLSEPSSRSYDVIMLLTYFLSLLFILGFATGLYFVRLNIKCLSKSAFSDPYFLYAILHLLLALAWPAAIPRLFLPVLPLIVLLAVQGFEIYFKKSTNNLVPQSLKDLLNFKSLFLLFVAYVVFQYLLRLQFLVTQKYLFLAVVFLNALILLCIIRKKLLYFSVLSLTSAVLVSCSVVWLHKDIYTASKQAALYVKDNLTGSVAFNEPNDVTNWYINELSPKITLHAFYYSLEEPYFIEKPFLYETNADYLIITNEHNPNLSLDLKKRSHLEEIKEFRYNVGSVSYYAKVVRIHK